MKTQPYKHSSAKKANKQTDKHKKSKNLVFENLGRQKKIGPQPFVSKVYLAYCQTMYVSGMVLDLNIYIYIYLYTINYI